MDNAPDIARRRFLVLGGMAVVAAACSSDDDATSSPTAPDVAVDSTDAAPDASTDATVVGRGATPFAAADFESLGVCTLLAATAAGPFPNPERLDRRDVTEGYPGHPTRLGLRVIDEACEPVPGAVVEIWHADATGDYSAYSDGGTGKDEGAGTNFMRGFQTAGDDGIVEFHTVYPGWYPGRAVHIHIRVHVEGDVVLTSQLFFDDAYSEAIFAEGAYAEFGRHDTTNETDGIAGRALTTGGLLTLAPGPTMAGEGTVALTNLGVAV